MERDIWLSAEYMKYHPNLNKLELAIEYSIENIQSF